MITTFPLNSTFSKTSYLWAVINLLITLTGVFFLHWSLQPLIYLFWLEVIFNIVSALIRAIGALDGKPFFKTLKQKIFLLIEGAVIGAAMIMLMVTFTISVFENFDFESFEGIQIAILALAANYIFTLLLNFFFNGRFRKAKPVEELITTLIYLLILLVIIMVITQHLIPALSLTDNARWVGLAVVGIKFVVDFLTSYFRIQKSDTQFNTLPDSK